MAQKKLVRQLFPSYLLITVGSLIVVTGYVSLTKYRFNMTQTQDALTRLAQIVRQDLVDSNALNVGEEVNQVCRRVGLATDDRVRVTVILPDGQVIGDSREEAVNMGDHSCQHD